LRGLWLRRRREQRRLRPFLLFLARFLQFFLGGPGHRLDESPFDARSLAIDRFYISLFDLLLEHRIRNRDRFVRCRKQHAHQEVVEREDGEERQPSRSRRHLRRTPGFLSLVRPSIRRRHSLSGAIAILFFLCRPNHERLRATGSWNTDRMRIMGGAVDKHGFVTRDSRVGRDTSLSSRAPVPIIALRLRSLAYLRPCVTRVSQRAFRAPVARERSCPPQPLRSSPAS